MLILSEEVAKLKEVIANSLLLAWDILCITVVSRFSQLRGFSLCSLTCFFLQRTVFCILIGCIPLSINLRAVSQNALSLPYLHQSCIANSVALKCWTVFASSPDTMTTKPSALSKKPAVAFFPPQSLAFVMQQVQRRSCTLWFYIKFTLTWDTTKKGS